MKVFHRPDSARLHRSDAWKQSAYAFVPGETHFGELTGFADDVVAPGQGFGMHGHRDMEITTVMLSGAQEHRDSTGGVHRLGSGGLQTMSAGTGIRHSEVNASQTEPFHSLQIWVYPKQRNTTPRHATFSASPDQARNSVVLALSPDGREGSAVIGQDAFFSLASLEAKQTLDYHLHHEGHDVYVHCARGEVRVADLTLKAGDAAGLTELARVTLEATVDAELVFVEVPMTRGIQS